MKPFYFVQPSLISKTNAFLLISITFSYFLISFAVLFFIFIILKVLKLLPFSFYLFRAEFFSFTVIVAFLPVFVINIT